MARLLNFGKSSEMTICTVDYQPLVSLSKLKIAWDVLNQSEASPYWVVEIPEEVMARPEMKNAGRVILKTGDGREIRFVLERNPVTVVGEARIQLRLRPVTL